MSLFTSHSKKTKKNNNKNFLPNCKKPHRRIMHIYENLATSPFCVRKSRQSTMHAHPPHSHTATQQTKLPKQIKVCENVRVEINRILCFLNSLHFESFLTQINVAFVLDVCAQHNCWLQLRYYITKQYYIRTGEHWYSLCLEKENPTNTTKNHCKVGDDSFAVSHE